MTTSADDRGGDVDEGAGREPVGRLRRNGLVRIVTDCRGVLGEDDRKLPAVVGLSFAMGLLEAVLILLVVQMAVALAAGREEFAVTLGPVSVDGLSVGAGVVAGVTLVVLLVACLVPVARLAGRLAARAQHRTRQRLVHAYLGASWTVRSRYPEGHLQELLTTYAERAERAVNQLVIASVAMCGLTSILLVAFITSPLVAGASIVCVAAVGMLLRPILTHTRAASGAYAAADRAFAGRMAEISRMTPEITAFDVAGPVEAAVDARAATVAASLRKIRMLMRLGTSLYQYLALLLVVLAVGAVALVADSGALATMGTVLILLVRALAYGQQLQSQVQTSKETAPFLERMEAEVATLTAAELSRTGTLVDEPAPLRFEDVHFAYEPGDDVLRGVSLEIAPGEVLGIVGRSGAGKSTLVQLLLRLRQPTAGRLVAGSVPLDEVALPRWYELVAYVPQENKLITGTVADNIRFFRSDIDDAAVESAARRAHLHDEVAALPDGYATEVGPGVRDLSGGQRQRLGIARALAGAPRLIILDEPTSALDDRSEALVTRTLAELRGSVTTVIVAHRPSTTAICDRIVRVHEGRCEVVPPSGGSDALLTPALD